MILALQMLQERGVGQQKDEERRREVGCQWESPVERREVGCQSETVERRDTAVQVDLLSQQLTRRQTGCRCVSIRADEPGGGALLQHCSTEQTGSCTLETGEQINRSLPQTDEQSPAQQLDLPNQEVVEKSAGLPPSVTPTSPINSTLPLYLFCANQKPPLLPSVLEEELPCLLPKMLAPPIQLNRQQITFIPSMPLCNDSSYAGLRCEVSPPPAPVDISAPPLGLIAPLSPRLAEEEEEDGATQQLEKKIQEAQQVGRSKRKVGPPVRYLLESEEQSHATMRGAKAKRGAGRARKVLLERDGEEELSSMDQEYGDEERERVAEVCAMSFTSGSTLQTHMMVHGSRWCLTRDLGNKRCNHAHLDIDRCHGDVAVPCYIQSVEACGTSEGKDEEDANGDAGMSDSPRYKEVMKRGDEEEDEPHFQAFTKGWWEQMERERGRKRQRSRDNDGVVKRVRIKEENGGEVQKGGEDDLKETPLKSDEKMTEQLQRPRRKMVGPPIRYLLESEEQSHVVLTASQDRAKGLKIKEGRGRLTKFLMDSKTGGGVSVDRVITESPEDTGETDRQAERQAGQPAEGETGVQSHSSTTSNQDTARELKIKRGRGRPRNVVMNNKVGDGASVDSEMKRGSGWEDQNRGRDEERCREEMGKETLLPGLTNAANCSRFGCVRRNGRHWLSYRKKIKTMREAIRKRWREQKEGGRERKTSRNEDAAVKQVQIEENGGEDGKEKPQRPRRKMVGPPIRYLLESEEQFLGVVTANQDRARGRLMKVLMDSKSGSGASVYRVMTDSSKDMGETDRLLHRQADQMLSERQAGLSHGPLTVNQDTVRGLKIKRGSRLPRKVVIHSKAGGGSSVDTRNAEWEKQKRQRDKERSKEEVEEDDMPLLPALTDAANWSRFRCVHGNGRHWLSYQKKSKVVQEANSNRCMEQKEGGTGRGMIRNEDAVVKRVQIDENGGKDLLKGREVCKGRLSQSKENRTEQLQRPRRKMVGPPIRYLLESEEQSLGVVTANQDRVRGTSKIKAGRGRPRKLLMDNKTEGGASVDRVFTASPEDRGETDRQAERQTDQSLSERKTGQPLRAGQTDRTLTERQTVHTLSEGQTGQPVTERQTSQTLSERQTGQLLTKTQMGQKLSDRQTGQLLTERQTGLYRMSYFIHKDIGSGQVTVLVPCFVRLEQIHF